MYEIEVLREAIRDVIEGWKVRLGIVDTETTPGPQGEGDDEE